MTAPIELVLAHFRRWRLFLGLVAVLLAVRFSLEPLVERYVNRELSRHPDYQGHVGDIDINLWRGAYEIEDLELVRRNGETTEPFLAAKSVDLSVEWSALVHGAVVGEVIFHEPDLIFVVAPSEEDSQTSIDRGWQQTLLDLFPFKINRIAVQDGKLRYRNESMDPVFDLELHEVRAVVQNLTNIREVEGNDPTEEELVATVDATGRPLGQGAFWLTMKVDPFATAPTFDLDASLQGLDLVTMNDFLRAYANLDVERGTFHLFAEIAASQGRITGYVKPFFEDVDVVSTREVEDPGDALQAAWEALAGGAAKLLENPEQERSATRVPIEGEIGGAQPDLLASIGNLLVHAFVRALFPGLDDSIELADVEKKLTGAEERERLDEEKERAREKAEVGSKPGSVEQ